MSWEVAEQTEQSARETQWSVGLEEKTAGNSAEQRESWIIWQRFWWFFSSLCKSTCIAQLFAFPDYLIQSKFWCISWPTGRPPVRMSVMTSHSRVASWGFGAKVDRPSNDVWHVTWMCNSQDVDIGLRHQLCWRSPETPGEGASAQCQGSMLLCFEIFEDRRWQMGFVLYDCIFIYLYIFVPRGALTARVYLSIPYPNPMDIEIPHDYPFCSSHASGSFASRLLRTATPTASTWCVGFWGRSLRSL